MKHHNKLGSVFAILFVIACVLVLGTAVFAQSEEAIEFDTYYSGGAQSFDTVDYYCRESEKVLYYL